MVDTNTKIIEAAIRVFVKYGPRKTSMGDIASEAGVSRQTLYDVFGNKADLNKAAIRFVTQRNLTRIKRHLDEAQTLAQSLDTYLKESVVKSFELLQSASRAMDSVGGHGRRKPESMEESHSLHEELVAEILRPSKSQIEAKGIKLEELAHFVVQSAMGFKSAASSRQDLDGLLATLKTSVLTIASG